MTTPWIPAGEWAGQTVAVLGPAVTADIAQALREHRTIAVEDACKHAPWADMLVALHGNWPQAWRDFAGWRVIGVDDDATDAFYVGAMFERIVLAPGQEVEVMDSGLAAIRIAAALGANRILLAGFEGGTPIACGVDRLIGELTILRRHTRRTIERYALPPAAAVKPGKTKPVANSADSADS